MSVRDGPSEPGDPGEDRELPWLAAPLRQTLATRHAHALLIHGPGGVGQFELALALARAWLCEAIDRPLVDRPCGHCPSCKLHAARSHPDLLVLVPEAMRESLGWDLGAGEGDDAGEGGKRKPSKEIRVEAVRTAIGFATTTSARGRGKIVVVHPAERMNDIAASAFLKTLEEPAGDARFLLCSATPEALLPTIRSRCQQVVLPVPPAREAEAIDALQKICHDAASLACGGEPRYFPRDRFDRSAGLDALLGWSRELGRVAAEVEHPWNVDLAIESLVGQGREALKTPRSRDRRGEGLSLNSTG